MVSADIVPILVLIPGALSDGTPLVQDHEDNFSITTALSGYVFHKTVENRTTGASPTATASPGDTLRYKLRLFNVDQVFNTIVISDLLDLSRFNASTFQMVTLPAGTKFSFAQGTGLLVIDGDPSALNLAIGGELIIEFELDLLTGLTNGDIISNQATLAADGPFSALSDDPRNGIAPPDDEDPTIVVIQAPGSLSKTNNQVSATIGQQFTYTIFGTCDSSISASI